MPSTMPATTSRPDQLDCIFYGCILFYILSLATLAIVPTKVCPSLPDVYARLEWLAVLIYGCHSLAFIPLTIYLDRKRTPMRFSDILNFDLVWSTVVIVLLKIVWTIFCVATIYLGLRFLYRRHPTWFSYAMEVDPKYVRIITSDRDAEKAERVKARAVMGSHSNA